MLTRKKCGQEEVPDELDFSKLQQNWAAISALSTQTLATISSFSGQDVKEVLDQPGLQEQLSVMQDFPMKTLPALLSSVNPEVVSEDQRDVENKPVIENQVKKQSSPAVQKSVSVDAPSADVMKQVPKRGRKPGTKNKPKIEDLTWDDYEFNSGDESNALAMTYEEKAELFEDLCVCPLFEIVRSRDPEQIDENGELLGVNFETLQPVTMHEIKAFVDFYLDTSNANWSVSTVRPKVTKLPKEEDVTLPLPKKSRIVVSKSTVMPPPPLKEKKPAAVKSKNVKTVTLDANHTLKPSKVLNQTDKPSKKERAFLSSTLNVLDDKLRAVDSSNHSNVQEKKLSPSQNSSLENNAAKSVIAIKPTVVNKAKITISPSCSNSKQVVSEESSAAISKEEPLDQEVNRLRRKEKERRRRESMAIPSFTQQKELMDWMEAQID